MNEWVKQRQYASRPRRVSMAGGVLTVLTRFWCPVSSVTGSGGWLPLVVCVLLAATSTMLLGQQKNVFEKPQRLEYGDPATIAPMMGPVMTIDWDRDGKQDLVGRNYWWPEAPKWWRNTGQQHQGVTLFERAGPGGIDERRYGDPTCTMIGHLDGDAFADAVVLVSPQGSNGGLSPRTRTSPSTLW